MGENKDVSVYEEDEICFLCGKRIYEWGHTEHIIPYVNLYKEYAKKL